MDSLSDSDQDFWDLGDQGDGTGHQGRRANHRKSRRFPSFPLSYPENDMKDHTHENREEPRIIKDYNEHFINHERSEDNAISSENDDDELECVHMVEDDNRDEENEEGHADSKPSIKEDEEREEGSGGSSESRSSSSKRTSLLTGSDLPQDSAKEATLSKDSSKISKGSSNQSQWLVEEYLLPPQQKLKLALYHGRKLLAAGEGEGAVREFIRARALARVVHGDQHWRYCRCKVFLAKTYLYLKPHPSARTDRAS